MEHVFDTVCRCFGGVPATAPSSRTSPGGSPSSRGQGHNSPEIKRRTSRLELQDKEWDGLFQHTVKPRQQKPLKHQDSVASNFDLEQARAVAQAKLAASPSSRRSVSKSRSSKRKSPASRRDEIFRKRRYDQPSPRVPQPQPPGNSLSRFLNNHQGVANALCFATPVRDDDEEEDAVPLNEPDDDSTLNTCEDTITSTIYFDAKYSHLVENRPPMPLFSHFKVNEEEDQIRRIVATDSHNSLKMIRRMHEGGSPVRLEDSSSEEEEEHAVDKSNVIRHHMVTHRRSCAPPDEDDMPPDPVKTNSSSGSSKSKSTASTAPSSSSPAFPESDGRVVHL